MKNRVFNKYTRVASSNESVFYDCESVSKSIYVFSWLQRIIKSLIKAGKIVPIFGVGVTVAGMVRIFFNGNSTFTNHDLYTMKNSPEENLQLRIVNKSFFH